MSSQCQCHEMPGECAWCRLEAKLEKAEAERDEWKARVDIAEVMRLRDNTYLLARRGALEAERDEARALASQPCDGIGCPHGEEAVRLQRDNARLREALDAAADALSSIDCAPDCVEGDRCKHCTNWQRACDALATDEVKP